MPFKSQAQRAFMYSQHPGLAREFEAATPKGVGLPRRLGNKHPANPPSESNESPAPDRARVRRQAARDFLGPKAGLERAAMKAGPVDFVQGSKGQLGTPSKPKGPRGRDVRVAAAALIQKGRKGR